MILGFAAPSATLRSILVVAIIQPICKIVHDSSQDGKKCGEYLILVAIHANIVSASMYQTSLSQNITVSNLAEEILGITWKFKDWLLGSWLPSIVSFSLLPFVMKYLSKVHIDMNEVKENLPTIGKIQRDEVLLACTIVVSCFLWISIPWTFLDEGQIGEIKEEYETKK